jgi:thiol:disulfide interchange protein DsbD
MAMWRKAVISTGGAAVVALLAALGLAVLGDWAPVWAQQSGASSATESLGWLRELVHERGVWIGLPAVFLGGLALNLTPCVYPMIPVTLAFFSSQARGATTRSVLLAGCYVLGLSLMYALLGLVAAKTGALFGSWLQQPAVLLGGAAVIVLLSLSLFGWYDLRLPSVVTRRLGQASAGLWGAVAMGAAVGVIAAPCVGPFVLGLLVLVGQLADPVQGWLLFFMLGLGMGSPYLVLGMAAHRAVRLPKAGSWLVWTKKALGAVLLGVALFLVNPLLAPGVARWVAAGVLAAAGLYLGWLEPSARAGRWWPRARWLIGAACLLGAAAVVWPTSSAARVAWTPYSEAALEQAQRAQRPILIDVYADWCLPCVEMEHVTFRRPEVAQALEGVATLRLDATRGISPDGERLLERYRVFGAPTTLFFDRSGQERSDLRLLGFAGPEEFLARLRRIL